MQIFHYTEQLTKIGIFSDLHPIVEDFAYICKIKTGIVCPKGTGYQMSRQMPDIKTEKAVQAVGGSADRPAMFPTWGDMVVMIAIFFGATLIGAGVMVLLRSVAPEMEKEPLTAATYFTQFVIAIGGIWFYRRSRGVRGSAFHFTLKWYNASLVILGLGLMLAVSVVMEPLLSLFPESQFEALNNAIGSGGWAILTAVVLAPVFEEMLFRGLILQSARQKWGATAAILLSAALFGLVHFPIMPQMLNAFVMGVMMGYIYVLTDSLLSVIIIHAVNNALAFLFLEITGDQTTDLRAMMGNDTIYWVVYAASLAVFIASLTAMAVIATEKRRKRYEIAAVFAENDDASPRAVEKGEAGDNEGNNNG